MKMGLNSTNSTNSTASPTFESCVIFSQSIEGKIPITVAYVLVILLSLFGNSVVIWTVWTTPAMKLPIHTFFLNMAVCDWLIPLIALPKQITELWYKKPSLWLIPGETGDRICKIYSWLLETLILASILSLVLITINRFIVLLIARPQRRAPRARRRYTIVPLVIVWLASAAFYTPYFRYFVAWNYKGTWRCQSNQYLPFAFHEAEFVVRSAIPFLIFLVLYSFIIAKVVHHRLPKNNMSDRGRQQRARERNITLLAMATVLVFVLLWLPYNVIVFKLLVSGGPLVCPYRKIIEIAQFLYLSQSAINPYILFTFSSNYQAALKRVVSSFLQCGPCRNSHVISGGVGPARGGSTLISLHPLGSNESQDRESVRLTSFRAF